MATDPVRVAHWGTYVTTPDVTDAHATVAVRTELQNSRPAAVKATLETTVEDAAGRQVTKSVALLDLAAGGTLTANQRLAVATPHRWDIDDPYLYSVVSVVKDGDKVLDRYVTPFGIRSVVFDKEKGLLLRNQWLRETVYKPGLQKQSARSCRLSVYL